MATHSNDWYLNGLEAHDPEVIQTILKENWPLIREYIMRNSGNQEDARDILQDGLGDIYLKQQTGGLILNCKFSTFLYAICRYKWLNRIRKKKNRNEVTIDNPEVLNITVEIETQIEKTEQYKLLIEKFEHLSEKCKKILRLSWHTDMNMKEIAKKLGLTHGTARNRKHSCIKYLTKLIKEDDRYDELKF